MKARDIGITQIGIKLHVMGSELIEHLKNRTAYHSNRAELYQSKVKEIEQLRREGDEAANKSIGKGSNTADPLDSLENSMKTHQAKARFFAFSHAHIVEDMVYVCDLADLTTFEIAPSSMRGY